MPNDLSLPRPVEEAELEPTNPSLGGNNRRQGRWRKNSFLTTFGQGSTTLRGR